MPPSTPRKHRFVQVSTFMGEQEEPEFDRLVDISSHGSREWLMKHISWAAFNGRVVEIEPYDP